MSIDLPMTWLLGVLLGSARIGGWFMLAPPFNHRAIPTRVKTLLSLVLAMSLAPRAPADLVESTDAAAATLHLILAVAGEFFVGAALGFIVMCIFSAVQAAGDLIDMLGGFSAATTFDPMSNTASAMIGRFYEMTALTILFASNAHLIVLEGILRTYRILPPGSMLDLGRLARTATSVGGGMVLSSLQIAAPIVAVLFLTDIGLGLLTRVAPSLNVFALGFSLKILITFAAVGLSVAAMPHVVTTLTNEATTLMARVTGR